MRLKKLDELRSKLPLPHLLIELIDTGRWVHPGDDVLRARIPFIQNPLVFLGSKDDMRFDIGPLMEPDEIENETFSEYLGSAVGERTLPWIDVERTLFIICNKWPGDDVGIALDYRTGTSPRVVAGDWTSGNRCIYHEISPSFEAFFESLGL